MKLLPAILLIISTFGINCQMHEKAALKISTYAGSYRFVNENNHTSGILHIYPHPDDKVLFYLEIKKEDPQNVIGILYDTLIVKRGIGIYHIKDSSRSKMCKLQFEFGNTKIKIKTLENNCGFETDLSADGIFERYSDTPKSLIDELISTKRDLVLKEKYKKYSDSLWNEYESKNDSLTDILVSALSLPGPQGKWICPPAYDGFNFYSTFEGTHPSCNLNPIQPVGWSNKNYFFYNELVMQPYTGEHEYIISVLNTAKNKYEYQKSFSFQNISIYDLLNQPKMKYLQKYLLEKYGYMATGPGYFVRGHFISNKLVYPNHEEQLFDTIRIRTNEILQHNDYFENPHDSLRKFQIYIKKNNGRTIYLHEGLLDIGSNYTLGRLSIIGYFINPLNKAHITIIILKHSFGFESESCYSFLVVGADLSK